MRFIFGLIIGVVLTLGVFYVHDSRVAAAREAEPGTSVVEVEIVNWDVLGKVTRDQVDFARNKFNELVGN